MCKPRKTREKKRGDASFHTRAPSSLMNCCSIRSLAHGPRLIMISWTLGPRLRNLICQAWSVTWLMPTKHQQANQFVHMLKIRNEEVTKVISWNHIRPPTFLCELLWLCCLINLKKNYSSHINFIPWLSFVKCCGVCFVTNASGLACQACGVATWRMPKKQVTRAVNKFRTN